jgi:DNA-binding LytR/AlgR family response regulator
MIIAANISLQLTKLGYEVTGILPRGEEVLPHLADNEPDIILMDIQLKGALDGIATAKALQADYDIPLIYLTANADDTHFERAKGTRPYAFISKPFKKLDLQRAIELTLARRAEEADAAELEENSDAPFLLSDRIFVRHKDKIVKVFLDDIRYIEADRSYCRIMTTGTEYLLSIPLRSLAEKLQDERFLRVHRSYLINLRQLDEIAENHVVIGQQAIPISKSYKEEFLRRIRLI